MAIWAQWIYFTPEKTNGNEYFQENVCSFSIYKKDLSNNSKKKNWLENKLIVKHVLPQRIASPLFYLFWDKT